MRFTRYMIGSGRSSLEGVKGCVITEMLSLWTNTLLYFTPSIDIEFKTLNWCYYPPNNHTFTLSSSSPTNNLHPPASTIPITLPYTFPLPFTTLFSSLHQSTSIYCWCLLRRSSVCCGYSCRELTCHPSSSTPRWKENFSLSGYSPFPTNFFCS